MDAAFSQQVPEKPEGMSDEYYSKYKVKLDTAIAFQDFLHVGVQLCNLKSPTDSVFKYLELGITQKSSNCEEIYHWYRLFKEDRFLVNIVKIDTLRFEKIFEQCQKSLGEQSYNEFLEKRIRNYELRKAKQTKLDSTKFNFSLIRELDIIHRDDQSLRKNLSQLDEKSEAYKEGWAEQKKLDSINLTKVEKIFQQYGYPTKEMVGYEPMLTCWLVLQHQVNLHVRLKYLPILEKAVKDKILGQGLLEIYKYRNEDLTIK